MRYAPLHPDSERASSPPSWSRVPRTLLLPTQRSWSTLTTIVFSDHHSWATPCSSQATDVPHTRPNWPSTFLPPLAPDDTTPPPPVFAGLLQGAHPPPNLQNTAPPYLNPLPNTTSPLRALPSTPPYATLQSRYPVTAQHHTWRSTHPIETTPQKQTHAPYPKALEAA